MAGITSTELRLPRLGKRIWIGLLLAILLVCGLLLLPGIIYLNYQVEWRVSAAIHMIPNAELRYSDVTDQNGFMTVKKFIYWIDEPFEQVKDYPFVTNFRQSSDPIKANIFSELTLNYSYQTYYLSELLQGELDSGLYFAPSDIRDEPFKLTSLRGRLKITDAPLSPQPSFPIAWRKREQNIITRHNSSHQCHVIEYSDRLLDFILLRLIGVVIKILLLTSLIMKIWLEKKQLVLISPIPIEYAKISLMDRIYIVLLLSKGLKTRTDFG